MPSEKLNLDHFDSWDVSIKSNNVDLLSFKLSLVPPCTFTEGTSGDTLIFTETAGKVTAHIPLQSAPKSLVSWFSDENCQKIGSIEIDSAILINNDGKIHHSKVGHDSSQVSVELSKGALTSERGTLYLAHGTQLLQSYSGQLELQPCSDLLEIDPSVDPKVDHSGGILTTFLDEADSEQKNRFSWKLKTPFPSVLDHCVPNRVEIHCLGRQQS